MITFRVVTNSQEWNNFLLSLQPNTFLQSWEWGQVQLSEQPEVIYLGIFEQDRQIGAALLVLLAAKRGRFLLCPHGPLFTSEVQALEHLPALLKHLKILARERQACAVRLAPLLIDSLPVRHVFHKLHAYPAPLHMHAELTWVKNITGPENELLQAMRKTTRHAVTKATRNSELISTVVRDPALITSRFYPLYQHTGRRHAFVLYSQKVISQQLATLPSFAVFVRYQERDVAAALIFIFGTTAFYYHGASVKLPARLPAAQLAQWEAIKEAKRLGCTRYNFWGIAPASEPRHPFAGITIFKTGFGGEAFNYLHAQDFPLNISYAKLWLTDTYRRLTRGF
jgi:peptidoglycan pentaglycine glycine transferase (the first glycine)